MISTDVNDPFRKRISLSRLDYEKLFLDVVGYGKIDGMQKLIWDVIIDAVVCYVDFGIRDRGPTVDDFYDAWRYFFRVKLDDPATWRDTKDMRTVSVNDETGKREVNLDTLSENELRAGTFDFHYAMSGMAAYMHIDRFRKFLKELRRQTVRDHQKYMREFIEAFAGRSFKWLKKGQQAKFRFFRDEWFDILVDPGADQSALAEVMAYEPERLKRKSSHRSRRLLCTKQQLNVFIRALKSGKHLDASADFKAMEEMLTPAFEEGDVPREVLIHHLSNSSLGCAVGMSA